MSDASHLAVVVGDATEGDRRRLSMALFDAVHGDDLADALDFRGAWPLVTRLLVAAVADLRATVRAEDELLRRHEAELVEP